MQQGIQAVGAEDALGPAQQGVGVGIGDAPADRLAPRAELALDQTQ